MSHKHEFAAGFEAAGRPTRRRRISIAATLTIVLILTLAQIFFKIARNPDYSHTNSRDGFDWESITPSRELRYVPCDGRYQCARLLLPMDWDAPEGTRWSNTVAIALMKLPAAIDILDPRYRGELFVDPGGPGASGVNFIKTQGDHLCSIVNDDSAVFDIVGFDPRGISRSTPRFSCFRAGNLQGRAIFAQNEGKGPWSERTLPIVWAKSAAFGHMCDPGNDTSEEALIKYYMTTASVAADMVGFIEASGARRAALLEQITSSRRSTGIQVSAEKLKELEYHPGQEKLQYWGFSYGTTLGGYFASMFPEKVNRMMLDGSGYLPDWAEGKWMAFLTNIDESLRTIFTTCFAAGAKCALFDPAGPAAIESSVMYVLDELKTNPIPIWRDDMVYPDVLTQEMVLESMFTATYDPYRRYPALARALYALQDRQNLNMTAISEFLPTQSIRSSDRDCASKDCAVEDGNWYHEANVAVSCSDTDPYMHNRSFSTFEQWSNDIHKQSRLFGHYFASDSTMACNGWPIRSRFRFDGPFGAKTSHPILFISNTLDPMSPVDNSMAGLDLFPGSGIILTNSGGHCSPRVPSRCRSEHIGNYMRTGDLPESGAVCETDYAVFEEP